MGNAFNVAALAALCSAMRAGRLAVLAGAGISLAPPACAPLFRPLRDSLLAALLDTLRDSLSEQAIADTEKLFDASSELRRNAEPVPEVLFEALHSVIGDSLFTALRIVLTTNEPNSQHRFLGALLGSRVRLLITTNFEDSFEQALRQTGKEYTVSADSAAIHSSLSALPGTDILTPQLWKLHGDLTAGSEETIRVTLSQIALERFDAGKFESLTTVAKSLPLLVVGYSGYDFDISKALIAAGAHGQELFWLSRQDPIAHDPSLTILASWKEKGHLLVGDAADLFAALAETPGTDVPFDRPVGDCAAVQAERRTQLRDWARSLPRRERLLALGILTWKLHRFAAAAEIFELAENQVVKESHAGLLFATIIFRASVLTEAGRTAEVGSLLDRAFAFLKNVRSSSSPEADWSEMEGSLLHQAGVLAVAQFRRAEAQVYYERALELAQLRKNGSLEMTVRQSYGALLGGAGHFKKAKAHFDTALKLAEQLGDRETEAKARHELSIILIENGDLAGAEGLLLENLQSARDIGHLTLEQGTLFELGILEERLRKDYEAAAKRFEESQRIARMLDLKRQANRCEFYLADILQEKELHMEAVARFTTCINAAQETGDLETGALAVARRARSLLLLDERDGVVEQLKAARKVAVDIQSPVVAEIDALLAFLTR